MKLFLMTRERERRTSEADGVAAKQRKWREKKQSQTFQKHICTSNYGFSRNKHEKSCHHEIQSYILIQVSFFPFFLSSRCLLEEICFSWCCSLSLSSATAASFTRDLIQLFYNKNPFISLHFVIQFSFGPLFTVRSFSISHTQILFGEDTKHDKTNRRKERERGREHTKKNPFCFFAEICRENKRNIKRWRNCCLFLFIKLWTEMSWISCGNREWERYRAKKQYIFWVLMKQMLLTFDHTHTHTHRNKRARNEHITNVLTT